MGEIAMKQGPNRWERGKNCFKMAKELALAKGWSFNWRLVEAADVGHDGEENVQSANSIGPCSALHHGWNPRLRRKKGRGLPPAF